MRKLRIVLCALVATMFVGTGAFAHEKDRIYQYGNTIYKLPEGWKNGRTTQDYIILYTDDDVKGAWVDCRIYTSAASEGTVEAHMDQVMAREMAEDETKLVKEVDSQKAQLGGKPAYLKGRVIKDRGNKLQIYIGLEIPGRFELLRYEGDLDDEKDAKKTQELMEQDVMPMLEGRQFVSQGAKPLVGTPTAGELDGIWWGGELQLRPGINGMESDFVDYTYTFFRDGRFFEGVPPEGLRAFDYDKLVERHTDEIGNYYIIGNQVILFYATGKERTLDYEDGNISRGMAHLMKATVPADGFRFEGNRSTMYYSAISTGAGSTGGVSASSFQAFRKDGTYTGSRFSSASGNFDGGGGFATSSKTPEAIGRYEVKDGQLHLTEPDGSTKVWEIMLLNDGGDGDTDIIIQGQFLKPADEK